MSERKYSAASMGSRIDSLLRPILTNSGFQVNYTVHDAETSADDFETPDLVLKFTGPDVDLLLANRAEVLLALEHLAMEMLDMPAEHHSLLCFDANDYRVLRIEELRLSAMTAAEKVKRTHTPFHFNPMSSRERRIIHLSLRDETAVRSESTGTGPFRQVVVVPADMKEIPPPIMPPPPPRGGGERGAGDRGGDRHGGRGFGDRPRRDHGRKPFGRGGGKRRF